MITRLESNDILYRRKIVDLCFHIAFVIYVFESWYSFLLINYTLLRDVTGSFGCALAKVI